MKILIVARSYCHYRMFCEERNLRHKIDAEYISDRYRYLGYDRNTPVIIVGEIDSEISWRVDLPYLKFRFENIEYASI